MLDQADVFTAEATRILEEEGRTLLEALRREAIEEALRARGVPVEVTASDVRRARARFVKRESPRFPATSRLLGIYAVMGAVMTIVGAAYPLVKPLLENADEKSRVGFMIAITGLGLMLASFVGRSWLNRRFERSARQTLERFESEKQKERDERRLTSR